MYQNEQRAVAAMGDVIMNQPQTSLTVFSEREEHPHPLWVVDEDDPVKRLPLIRKSNRFERMYGKTPTSKHRA